MGFVPVADKAFIVQQGQMPTDYLPGYPNRKGKLGQPLPRPVTQPVDDFGGGPVSKQAKPPRLPLLKATRKEAKLLPNLVTRHAALAPQNGQVV